MEMTVSYGVFFSLDQMNIGEDIGTHSMVLSADEEIVKEGQKAGIIPFYLSVQPEREELQEQFRQGAWQPS